MTGAVAQHATTEWNLLVTAHEGFARDLKRFLRPLGQFWWSDFRNVLLGTVVDIEEFLRALATSLEQKPFATAWLGKALPIVATFPVQPETFVEDAQTQLHGLMSHFMGASFHVRVERRGHKGQLQTHDLERQLGDYLYEELRRREADPVVSFTDPEVVVGVEIVGETAGIALIWRRLRHEYPFVKLD